MPKYTKKITQHKNFDSSISFTMNVNNGLTYGLINSEMITMKERYGYDSFAYILEKRPQYTLIVLFY